MQMNGFPMFRVNSKYFQVFQSFLVVFLTTQTDSSQPAAPANWPICSKTLSVISTLRVLSHLQLCCFQCLARSLFPSFSSVNARLTPTPTTFSLGEILCSPFSLPFPFPHGPLSCSVRYILQPHFTLFTVVPFSPLYFPFV